MTSQQREARKRFNNFVAENGGDRAVSDLLGCSRSYVCLVRTGKRMPGIGVAAAIARVAEIPAELWDQTRKPRGKRKQSAAVQQ